MEMEGVVKSSKMDKTVVVEIRRKVLHPRYHKYITKKTKVYAHSEDPIEEGTKVVVRESRPISKLKRWVVVNVSEEKK